MVVWMALSRFILNGIFSEDEAYKAFLNETTTFRVISGVLYYSIIVSIYYLIINFRELKVKMARESQLNDMVKDAELKMLRSQIRPHFLFNSLNSISSLTMSNPEKAQEMVVKLSEFMRYSLNYTEEKLISLDKEIYHIQLYLDIEKVRFGKKLVMSYHIPDKCKELKLPALILQPLIENTIKYGLYEATGEIKIKIEANCETQFLFIKIGNDFDPDATPKKGTGTGLNNVQKRLETVYSAFDLMKINKQETYFEVEIKIPQHGKN
jgi:two-component system LytT family sensor kinase